MDADGEWLRVFGESVSAVMEIRLPERRLDHSANARSQVLRFRFGTFFGLERLTLELNGRIQGRSVVYGAHEVYGASRLLVGFLGCLGVGLMLKTQEHPSVSCCWTLLLSPPHLGKPQVTTDPSLRSAANARLEARSSATSIS